MSNQTNEDFQYEFHGPLLKASQLNEFIKQVIKSNEEGTIDGNPNPICVWGKHGIGKTKSFEQFAKEHNYDFVYIAPAQFEEMGDLLGMPKINDNGETEFAIPDWVPTEEKKGILLIDDVNRADPRILNGIMQLLQNYELVSWKLPKGWQIMLTANPGGGDYSVTDFDDAQLTRMLHTTMQFDVKEWARWAELNGVDERVINFILKYPEIIDGEQTTARSIVKMADTIKGIKDLKENLSMVSMLARASIGKEAAQAFITFVNDNLSEIMNPDEIINTKQWSNVKKQINGIIKPKDILRNDIALVICTRFINYVTSDLTKKFEDYQVKNIIEFCKLDVIPEDIKLQMLTDIGKASDKNKTLRPVRNSEAVANLLLEAL